MKDTKYRTPQKRRKVCFVTPTKSIPKKHLVSPCIKPTQSYFCISGLKTKGIQNLLDHIQKVESENVKLRQKEKKLKAKLEKCEKRKQLDKERFNETVIEMASRIFTERGAHEKVRNK